MCGKDRLFFFITIPQSLQRLITSNMTRDVKSRLLTGIVPSALL